MTMVDFLKFVLRWGFLGSYIQDTEHILPGSTKDRGGECRSRNQNSREKYGGGELSRASTVFMFWLLLSSQTLSFADSFSSYTDPMSIIQVELPILTEKHVERSYVVLMQGHMSRRAWNIVCEDLDETLEEYLQWHRRGDRVCMISVLLFIFSILLTPLLEVSLQQPGLVPSFCSIGCVGLSFACMGGLFLYDHRSRVRLEKKIQCICEQESLKYNNHLSFHFREKLVQVQEEKSSKIVYEWYIDIHVCCPPTTTTSAIPLGFMDQEIDMAFASTQDNNTDHRTSFHVEIPRKNGHVDKTMSVLLKRHMSQQEWNILLENLDKVLNERRQVNCRAGYYFCVSVLFGTIFLVLIFTVAREVPKSPLQKTAAIAVPIILFVFISCGLYLYLQSAYIRTKENLKSICREESLKYKHLCFNFEEKIFRWGQGHHIRIITKWYMNILILPSSTTSATSLEFMEQESSMAVAPDPFSMGHSPVERLEQLDETIKTV